MATDALKARRELTQRVTVLARDFDEEKESTFEAQADMARQYKAMQQELLSRIDTLEHAIDGLKDKLGTHSMCAHNCFQAAH